MKREWIVPVIGRSQEFYCSTTNHEMSRFIKLASKAFIERTRANFQGQNYSADSVKQKSTWAATFFIHFLELAWAVSKVIWHAACLSTWDIF